jgi:hypothetical protein
VSKKDVKERVERDDPYREQQEKHKTQGNEGGLLKESLGGFGTANMAGLMDNLGNVWARVLRSRRRLGRIVHNLEEER